MHNAIEKILIDKLNENSSFKLLFFGLAKNVGKTTAFNYIYELLLRYTKNPIVLLSTGYDGEENDSISGVSKPKINVLPGSLFITSLSLLNPNDKFRTIRKLPYYSSFGELMIFEALGTMNVPLISLGNNANLTEACETILAIYPQAIILLDGSINRRAFLKVASSNDLVVLSIGATYSESVEELLLAIEYYSQLFSLKQPKDITTQNIIHSLNEDNFNSNEREYIVNDISSIFLTPYQFRSLRQSGKRVYCKNPPPVLSFITINPFKMNGDRGIENGVIQNLFSILPIVDIHLLKDANS